MDSANPQVNRFLQQINQEEERQKFQEQVLLLCSKCFDICVPDSRPPNRMDSKVESCVTNCAERMVDADMFMAQYFMQKMKAENTSQSHPDF